MRSDEKKAAFNGLEIHFRSKKGGTGQNFSEILEKIVRAELIFG